MQFTPVLAQYDPFGVDVPLNLDIPPPPSLVYKQPVKAFFQKNVVNCHRRNDGHFSVKKYKKKKKQYITIRVDNNKLK